jgi:hypothetical protein
MFRYYLRATLTSMGSLVSRNTLLSVDPQLEHNLRLHPNLQEPITGTVKTSPAALSLL